MVEKIKDEANRLIDEIKEDLARKDETYALIADMAPKVVHFTTTALEAKCFGTKAEADMAASQLFDYIHDHDLAYISTGYAALPRASGWGVYARNPVGPLVWVKGQA